jgi:hypothetical protein
MEHYESPDLMTIESRGLDGVSGGGSGGSSVDSGGVGGGCGSVSGSVSGSDSVGVVVMVEEYVEPRDMDDRRSMVVNCRRNIISYKGQKPPVIAVFLYPAVRRLRMKW